MVVAARQAARLFVASLLVESTPKRTVTGAAVPPSLQTPFDFEISFQSTAFFAVCSAAEKSKMPVRGFFMGGCRAASRTALRRSAPRRIHPKRTVAGAVKHRPSRKKPLIPKLCFDQWLFSLFASLRKNQKCRWVDP